MNGNDWIKKITDRLDELKGKNPQRGKHARSAGSFSETAAGLGRDIFRKAKSGGRVLAERAGPLGRKGVSRAAAGWGRMPLRIKAVLITVMVLIAASGINTKIVHRKVWLARTRVNGVDVSGKTLEETLDLLPDGRDYKLTILARKNGKMIIGASDIDYHIHVDRDRLEEDFKKQHRLIVFPWASWEYEVSSDDGYDRDLLADLIDNSVLIKGSKDYSIDEPVSADVIYSEKEGKPVIRKEVQGNTLNRDAFAKVVEEALEKGNPEIDLNDEETCPDVYESPAVTAKSREIKEGLKAYNSYINRYISWEIYPGETYTIPPEKIIPLVYYANGRMSLRIYKLEKLIRTFCSKYQTAGKPRTFTTHKGKKIRIDQGDYGWKLDFDKTLDQAETAIAEELDEKAVEAYMSDPSEANKKAVTITLEPQYKTLAFLKDYENYEDWDPDTYTEVSLKEQMIYVHRDGKIAFECKTISGLPVEGRKTGKGVFYIKGRSRDRVLKGDDYTTPVKYWIRITNSGTGFHAAPWQDWKKWSPTWYKKHGSHGCLNLSDKNAKKMYELLEDGEAVFIY